MKALKMREVRGKLGRVGREGGLREEGEFFMRFEGR